MTSNPYYPDMNEILDRLVAIEEEASNAAGFQTTAAGRFLFVSELGLYWKNRPAQITTASDESEEFTDWTIEMRPRLIIGANTSGSPGDPETILYKLTMPFLAFVNAREGLQSKQFPTAMDALWWGQDASSVGLADFSDSGSETVSMVGTEFPLTLTFTTPRIQWRT